MSKITEIRENTVIRSKALLGTVADILENVSKHNLAFADDVAGFAIGQVRLPTEADDFSDYRNRTRDAYSQFGKTLKAYGVDMIEVVREVPGQVRGSFTIEDKPVMATSPAKARTTRARAKPKAQKKAAAKKATAARSPDRKAPARKVAKAVTKPARKVETAAAA